MADDADGNAFSIGEWLVEPELNRIVRGEEIVKIDPRNMRLLQLLASRPKQVVSQIEIERTVWSDVVVTPNSVYQSIAQLRRALGDEKANPRYIETIARKGYRLVGEIRDPFTSTDWAQASPNHVVESRPRRRALRWTVMSGVAAATMIATAVIIWKGPVELPTQFVFGTDSLASTEFYPPSIYASYKVPESPHARTNLLVERSLAANNDGRPEQALAYAEQAVALERRISGDNSPDTAEKLAVLALAHHWLADYEAAERNARAALSIFESTPVMHPGKVDALGHLGSILTDRGKFIEAAEYLEQAIELADRLYGESSGRAAASRCNLVALRNMEERYAEAEALARELLLQQAVNRSYKGVEAMVRTELASSLLRQNRYKEARAELVILLG
jgi:DNA-binding winged helix-turn-helix (wHTH) protein